MRRNPLPETPHHGCFLNSLQQRREPLQNALDERGEPLADAMRRRPHAIHCRAQGLVGTQRSGTPPAVSRLVRGRRLIVVFGGSCLVGGFGVHERPHSSTERVRASRFVRRKVPSLLLSDYDPHLIRHDPSQFSDTDAASDRMLAAHVTSHTRGVDGPLPRGGGEPCRGHKGKHTFSGTREPPFDMTPKSALNSSYHRHSKRRMKSVRQQWTPPATAPNTPRRTRARIRSENSFDNLPFRNFRKEAPRPPSVSPTRSRGAVRDREPTIEHARARSEIPITTQTRRHPNKPSAHATFRHPHRIPLLLGRLA